MTIEKMIETAANLETEMSEPLKAASDDYFSRKIQPKDKAWQLAWAKLTFWTDARNGLRQAQDALGALALIERGGDWS